MDYILWSHPTQRVSGVPVMFLTADGLDAVPTSVTPYDPSEEKLVSLTQELIRSIQDHPEFNTLGHIAVSYGGLTDTNGGRV